MSLAGLPEYFGARPVASGDPGGNEGFGRYLVSQGLLSAEALAQAHWQQAHGDAPLDQVLLSHQVLSGETLLRSLAAFHRVDLVDLTDTAPDARLLSGLNPHFWLKNNAIPFRKTDGGVEIAVAHPADFANLEPQLPASLRPATMVIARRDDIHETLAQHFRSPLTRAAARRVDISESCRRWGPLTRKRLWITCLAIAAITLLTLLFPRAVFTALVGWATLTLLITTAIRAAAYVAHLGAPPPAKPNALPIIQPRISVLVPLFRETEIANALIRRLSRLTYPKALLDVVLVLEENDLLTRKTLANIDLPNWMRVVAVPDDTLKTKPRAMNYALDFCQGEIIGIWDAEDAPDPDQLEQVAAHFHHAAPDVACLQGVLDYYNPSQNWLARCFTIEYATWFRVMLPGLSRLGFAIPLGGTTLFFRRDALEELGGWDAHNVTEDADLGFRLARHGYRTEMIATTTHEEANCRLWPWVRQRSRWLKGYMVTYLVHMRAPRLLYRQLGGWRFWGYQAHFIGALSQFTLAPLLWSFWLVPLGLPHPLAPLLPASLLVGCAMLFLAVEAVNMLANLTAVSRPGHRHLLPWVPTLHLYYPLGAVAAYKALYELVFHPFYWDKTQHGLSLPATIKPAMGAQFSPVALPNQV